MKSRLSKTLWAIGAMVLGTVFAGNAWARSSDDDAVRTQPDRTVTVGVPQSEIALESIRYQPPRPVEYEVSVSTWAPSAFARPSYTGPSTFSTGDIPALSVNRLGEIAVFKNGLTLSSKIGFTFLDLERSANTSFAGVAGGADTQNLNMFMARIGAELAWRNLLPWGLEPNLGFSLLPTWATASESTFEHSVSAVGFPFEGTLGLLVRLGARTTSERGDISVGVAGQAVAGSVGGSSVSGYGIGGLLRISL